MLFCGLSAAFYKEKFSSYLPQDSRQFHDLEKRLANLNERFVALQMQHARMVKIIISMQEKLKKPPQQLQDENTGIFQQQRFVLDVVDKIGEKIRFSEPFISLLRTIPKKFTDHASFRVLTQFAAKPPLSFIALQKAFYDIQKESLKIQQPEFVPSWLEKMANVFKGSIKISTEKRIDSSLKVIQEALELQDLKTAFSFAKNVSNPLIQRWVVLAEERLHLEEQYQIFVEYVQAAFVYKNQEEKGLF